jgi:hypothetical protein
MVEPTPSEIRVRDPLSEVTRKERRLLLGVSVIGLALTKIGLIPEKISSLGLEFTAVNQKSLLYLVAIIVAYFLAAFAIYSATDLIAWRMAWRNVWEASLRKRRDTVEKEAGTVDSDEKRSKIIKKLVDDRFRGNRIIYGMYGPAIIVRALFEFLLPIIVGLYTIISLLIYRLP